MNFQEHYAELSDGELLRIAADRADLVEEAALAMDYEMARRGLGYEEARSRKREAARLEIKEAMRHRSPRKRSKYFDTQANGWMLLLLVVGVPLLFLASMFLHVIPEKWSFSALVVSMGVVQPFAVVQPWVRHSRSFWISLLVSCAVHVFISYAISVHLAPQTSGAIKGAGFFSLVPGYAVGALLFLLLQKMEPGKALIELS